MLIFECVCVLISSIAQLGTRSEFNSGFENSSL